jgi:MFS transporter, FSR family, fosmidomycin resistance protein
MATEPTVSATLEATAEPLPRLTHLTPHAQGAVLTLVLLSCGHFVIDLYSSAIGAMQPLLADKLHLSLTQAGILAGTFLLSNSVTQPLYGFLSDRFHTRMFSALAPAVAGLFVSSIGRAPSFAWLLGLAVLGGAGIASFHPQAASNATAGLVRHKAQGMAIFVSSGSLGLAIGPSVFSFVAGHWGLANIIWVAVLGVSSAALLLIFLPLHEAPTARQRRGVDWEAFRPFRKQLIILYLLVFIRSTIQVTYNQFVPLFLHLERGYSPAAASYILSVYLAGGALGGFLGGNLADRFGGRRIIMISMIGSLPFLCLFMFGHGMAAAAGLVIGGSILLFTVPVNVVMAQQLVPSQAGTISAMMMGFAWGMAGLVLIPITGWLADRSSLHTVLSAWLVFPVLGFFLTMMLPEDRPVDRKVVH